MTTDPPAADATASPILDAEQAAFMQSGVSINAGSCSKDLVPSIVRAVGCRVSADRKRVSILVSMEQAANFLDDIRATGCIAVTFVRPSTHRSIQVKGRDASVVESRPGDGAIAERLCADFVAELMPVGYEPEMVRAVLSCDASTLVAVEFTPAAAYLQTPGPKAGQPLKAGA